MPTQIAFGQSFSAVPEITCSALIKLNARVSLLHAANRIGSDHRTVPKVCPAHTGKAVRREPSAWRLCSILRGGSSMVERWPPGQRCRFDSAPPAPEPRPPAGGLFVWQALCSAHPIAMHSYRPCTRAEQEMTRLHHLQTPNEERSARAAAKRRAIEERKRVAMIEALQRMRQRTEAVLLDLKNAATLLDCSIETELQSSPSRDPRHFAFPMTVRALIARRDNLEATIAALSEELARGNQPEHSVA